MWWWLTWTLDRDFLLLLGILMILSVSWYRNRNLGLWWTCINCSLSLILDCVLKVSMRIIWLDRSTHCRMRSSPFKGCSLRASPDRFVLMKFVVWKDLERGSCGTVFLLAWTSLLPCPWIISCSRSTSAVSSITLGLLPEIWTYTCNMCI